MYLRSGYISTWCAIDSCKWIFSHLESTVSKLLTRAVDTHHLACHSLGDTVGCEYHRGYSCKLRWTWHHLGSRLWWAHVAPRVVQAACCCSGLLHGTGLSLTGRQSDQKLHLTLSKSIGASESAPPVSTNLGLDFGRKTAHCLTPGKARARQLKRTHFCTFFQHPHGLQRWQHAAGSWQDSSGKPWGTNSPQTQGNTRFYGPQESRPQNHWSSTCKGAEQGPNRHV